MKIRTKKDRNYNQTKTGFGTIEGLLIAGVVCSVIYWSAGSIKAALSDKPSSNEAIALAQEVITVAEAAKSAGLDLIDRSSISNTVEKISSGSMAQNGTFAGQFFGMPQLSEKDKEIVARHLTFEYGKLSLNASPSTWE